MSFIAFLSYSRARTAVFIALQTTLEDLSALLRDNILKIVANVIICHDERQSPKTVKSRPGGIFHYKMYNDRRVDTKAVSSARKRKEQGIKSELE